MTLPKSKHELSCRFSDVAGFERTRGLQVVAARRREVSVADVWSIFPHRRAAGAPEDSSTPVLRVVSIMGRFRIRLSGRVVRIGAPPAAGFDWPCAEDPAEKRDIPRIRGQREII